MNKKEETKESENITILLETDEGNIKTNNFPNKEEYEYDKIDCTNLNNNTNITPSFNNETWKLNLTVTSAEKIDGDSKCKIYFKEIKSATETIITKYSEDNNEGLIKIDQPVTSQTPKITEYRYSGSNDSVKNYVRFNDEIWRIIGVSPVDDGTGKYEQRVKIIRDEPIGNYSWDTSVAGINDYTVNAETIKGAGVNQWGESADYEGADLMRLLNPGYESDSINNSLYWNRESGTCYSLYNNSTKSCDFTSTGLNEEARNMISDTKWYLGVVKQFDVKAVDTYIQEKGNVAGSADVGINVIKTVNWVGKVALPYSSDYGYASSECYELLHYLILMALLYLVMVKKNVRILIGYLMEIIKNF